MRVLVTGGAGYIGSVVVEQLLADRHDVVVLDDLRKGHAAALAPEVPLFRVDLADRDRVRALLGSGFDAVVHMAADSLVGESIARPGAYYRNNVIAGLGLLDAMVESGVNKLVFSSSAAVYGEPDRHPIDEDAPTRPTNPYGQTKLALERAFPWYAHAHGLRAVSLRYFNAAGASERCGEQHEPETHLIPLVLNVAAGGTLTGRVTGPVMIHGDDYPTGDGTCVRDYIHVVDLARAHVLALASLDHRDGCDIYNLGCGGGYSVIEVIEAARRVTGAEVPIRRGPRRPNPAVLVASSTRIQRELGWTPTLPGLDAIVGSAWRWRLKHPRGYPASDVCPPVSRARSRA